MGETKNLDWKKPRYLARGSLLAAIALALQAAPFYLSLAGVPFSSLSTLPIAMAAYLHGVTGLLTYLAAGALLSLWSVPRALLFCCGTGLLGLSLGIMMRRGFPLLRLAILSGIALATGILGAAAILEVPLLPWLKEGQRQLLVPLMLIWCVFYAAVWIPVLNMVLMRLQWFFKE